MSSNAEAVGLESYSFFYEYEYLGQDSIHEATDIIDIYSQRNDHVPFFTYDDDIWHLYELLQDNIFKINFPERLRAINVDLEDSVKINIYKCWIASLINSRSIRTIFAYVNGLQTFYEITDGYSKLNFAQVIASFNKYSGSKQGAIICAVNNISDYSINNFYTDTDKVLLLIYQIEKQFKDENKNNVRTLPNSKDILVFDYVVQDFFEKEKNLGWLPIYIWWKLTTIIPLRISEFMMLSKNCISERNGEHFIELTRIKNTTDKVQLVNLIKISEELYELFEYYLENTKENMDKFIWHFQKSSETLDFMTKHVRERFTAARFAELLNFFYEKVVYGEYEVIKGKDKAIYSIERELRPNDTRHLAFINLKRQGYHPIEVARLGGHLTLKSQQHYFSHLNNLLDLELLSVFSTNEILLNDSGVTKGFIEQSVLKPPINENYRMKLDIGYCTDENMTCMVSSCFDCESWRIGYDEFQEKKIEINKELGRKNKEIYSVLNSLKKLYIDIYSNVSMLEKYNIKKVNEEGIVLNSKAEELNNRLCKYLDFYKLVREVQG